MLDEEMDDIIRKAAENHHPAYNDKAWEMMEAKLDKHLPQKKDRRKPIFFLLFFLLLGGGLFFIVNRFTGNANDYAVSAKVPAGKMGDQATAESSLVLLKPGIGKDQIQATVSNNGNETGQISDNPDNNTTSIILNAPVKKDNNDNNEDLNKGAKKLSLVSTGKTKVNITSARPYGTLQDEDEVTATKNSRNGKTAGKRNITITGAVPENEKAGNNIASNSADVKKLKEVKPETIRNAEPEKEKVVNKEEKKKELTLTDVTLPSTPDKKKSKKNIAGNFGFNVSVGPEMSFINLNNPGKVTLIYGAGLSYSFTKRFTARAGVYFSKKIYEATPDQYHEVVYPNLTSIDANCKVLEIPVGLTYGFAQKNKHSWFAGAGLSSFFMKKEDYNYNYKTGVGQTYNYYKEITNENKHYFAVLTLSGGYNYQLSKRVSIQAEPYLKLPLSGVGLGKIKLNSGGVLFTITVKPFARGK